MPDDPLMTEEPEYNARQQRALGGIKRREEALGALRDVFGREGGRRSRQLNRQITRSRNRFGLEDADSGARDSSELGLQDINALQGLIRPREGRGQGLNRASVFSKQAELGLADRRQQESQQYLDENVQPTLDMLNERIQTMLQEPEIRAHEEAAMRSRAIEMTRRTETDRLKRLQGVFGSAGIAGDSPVAHVLANRSAQEADAELARLFQNIDFELAQARRAEDASELSLASRVSAQNLATRQAATTGDFDRLIGIQSELGGLFEGIQQQSEAIDLARSEARDADKQSPIDYFNTGLSTINNLASTAGNVMTAGQSTGLWK